VPFLQSTDYLQALQAHPTPVKAAAGTAESAD